MAKTEGYIVTVEVFVSKDDVGIAFDSNTPYPPANKKQAAIQLVEGALEDAAYGYQVKNVRKSND